MMRATNVSTMTKSEIEHKFVASARTQFRDISLCNAMMRDTIKGMAKSLFPLMEGYTGDPKDFKFKPEDKTKATNDTVPKMMAIAATFFNKTKRTASAANSSIGLKPGKWDMEEFMNRSIYDKNLSLRFTEQAKRAASEIEVYAALGIKNGNTPNEAMFIYLDDMDAPHRNRDIQELAFLGFIALKGTDILKPRFGGISSAYKSISRIMEDYMMRGYSEANMLAWKGLYKYIITSADHNVCSVCQDNATRIFKAEEFIVPAHNRCRCIEIPILDYTDNIML